MPVQSIKPSTTNFEVKEYESCLLGKIRDQEIENL